MQIYGVIMRLGNIGASSLTKKLEFRDPLVPSLMMASVRATYRR